MPILPRFPLFYHVAFIAFRPEVSAEDRLRVYDILDKLGLIPEVRDWRLCWQANPNRKFEAGSDRQIDLVELASFDSEEAYQNWRRHPDHLAAVEFLKQRADWRAAEFSEK